MNETEEQQRIIALASCGGVCEVCGKQLSRSTWQGAHRIANTKANRNKYGALVIDHPLNIAIVCSLRCNDSCNIGYKPRECLKLAKKVYEFELKKF